MKVIIIVKLEKHISNCQYRYINYYLSQLIMYHSLKLVDND